MSPSQELRFPSGHTPEQVKRNAKRLAKERNLALNQALDQLACAALGLPGGTLHWAEALQALQHSQRCYGHHPENYIFPATAREAFTDGIIVAIDVKDAERFVNPAPWVLDEDLKDLMVPSLLSLYASTGAEEDGRKIPNKEDWSYAFDYLFDPVIFRYAGPTTDFANADDVIRDICKRNFFPPDHVWIRGQLGGWSQDSHPHVVYL